MDKLHYLYIFFQSNAIEVCVYYFFYRKSKRFWEVAQLTTFSNAVTHPIVFFVFMALKVNYLQSILLAEAFAIVAETFLHAYFGKMNYRESWGAAFISNLVSWQVAPLLTYVVFFTSP